MDHQPPAPHEQHEVAEHPGIDWNATRRDWMFQAGMGLNILAGALLTLPLIGFVFSSAIKRKDPRTWIPLGKLEHFPEKQTRMATYRNPFTRPWDGETA